MNEPNESCISLLVGPSPGLVADSRADWRSHLAFCVRLAGDRLLVLVLLYSL
jgi:hypothetical protein